MLPRSQNRFFIFLYTTVLRASILSSLTNHSLISVILPSCNARPFVRAAVDSVLHQTYPNVELVIVDNSSNDGTWEIVSSIRDSRVRSFSVRNDALISASRNYGLQKARGEFVAFVDHDDAWHNEKLESQLPHLADAGISCVSTNFLPMGDVVHCHNHLSFGTADYCDYGYREMALFNPVMTSSLLARKNGLLAAGGFDEHPDFRFIEDWELWLRMSRQGRIRVLARPLLNYRVARKTGRNNVNIKLNSLKIFDKHRRLGYLDEALHSLVRGNCLVDTGRACLESDDRRGVAFLLEGLARCEGILNRMRALAALALFALPLGARQRLIETIQQVRWRVLGKQSR